MENGKPISLEQAIAQSEIDGGCRFAEFPEGKILKVQTRNTLYEIRKHDSKEFIRGNKKYCPDWTECRIVGSTWGGSMLKMRYIGINMFLEIYLSSIGNTITTSAIQTIEETNE